MKMKLEDITPKDGICKRLHMVAPRPVEDPVADMYRRVRDIALEDGVAMGLRVAVLDLIKTELLGRMQEQISAE